MHDDEVGTDASLVRRLGVAQFRHWADLDIEPVLSDGTDHAMYRLGRDLAARLPRRPRAAMAVDEATWIRGRAWALAIAVVNLSYYRTRSGRLAEQGRHVIAAVLADHASKPMSA